MELLDYRNGKYQGGLSGQLRQGVGIFIDDDLAFHLSHWKHGQLDGPTLLYLSHGKYLYGLWKNDLPHGLNVFRCADTVLVGAFKEGTPTGRCLVVFQRFNLACILEQGEREWRVATSGQLQNHNSLLKFVEQLGVVVPDHCFSLTKFVSSFSNSDPRLKTFPTHGHHCYFGFLNGLALVFNPTNALLSVGYHRNQQLAEFGARFEGSRSAEEGNFQNGGEKVRYVGERPSAKIYSIFQKLHKQSLNFKNEYFESRRKVFLAVEELVRGKLSEIGEECRRNHLGLMDLNDSLDFQDHDEQESLRINSMREQVYSPPDNTKFFRKPEKTQEKPNMNPSTVITANSVSRIAPPVNNTPKAPVPTINAALSRLKDAEPKSPTVRKAEQNVYTAKKSPIRSDKKEVYCFSSKKSASSNQPPTPKQTSNLKQIEEEGGSESHREATKAKEKMKSNNLRYINEFLGKDKETFKEEKRTASAIKSNNIYKDSARKHEQDCLKESVRAKPEEDYEYRVPTFKGLAEQIENNKKKRKEVYLEPEERRIIPQERQERLERTPDRFNERKQTVQTYLPKKTADIANLSRPNYEDIDERRQRIIREFKDLNKSGQKQPEPKANEIPNANVYSIPYEEQGSFGYLPLTISNHNKQPTSEKMKESRYPPPSFAKKENTPTPEVRSSLASNPYASSTQRNSPLEGNPFTAQTDPSSPPRKKLNIYVPADVNENGGGTPYRQKRNYQYLYD